MTKVLVLTVDSNIACSFFVQLSMILNGIGVIESDIAAIMSS